MTNTHKIELANKGYKLYKEEAKRNIIFSCMWAAVSLFGIIVTLLASERLPGGLFLKMIAFLFGVIMMCSILLIILRQIQCKFVADFINDHEFEIVRRNFDNECWYCIHLLNTEEYLRAEVIEEE